MGRLSERTRLTLLGVVLLSVGATLGAYVASAAGTFDVIAPLFPRISLQGTPLTRGEHIYGASCASCHGGPTGGALSDYPPKHNANGHTWQHGDCELVAIIRTGAGLRHDVETRPASPPAAVAMPAWRDRLSEEQIGDVIAFIRTMWTPDQRASQERVTRERCGATSPPDPDPSSAPS